MGMSTFQISFVQEAYLQDFSYVEAEKVSFKNHAFDFSVNYVAIGKSDISNIHKYLMINMNV